MGLVCLSRIQYLLNVEALYKCRLLPKRFILGHLTYAFDLHVFFEFGLDLAW